jgi:hypothetical protein
LYPVKVAIYLKNLEKPGICIRDLENLKKRNILKKNLERLEKMINNLEND